MKYAAIRAFSDQVIVRKHETISTKKFAFLIITLWLSLIRIFPYVGSIFPYVSYPYFPVFGQNLRFCLDTGKCGYDFVHIWENTDQRKPVFQHISCSVLLNIFSHNLALRKNISFASARKFFVREHMNCLTAQNSKARK